MNREEQSDFELVKQFLSGDEQSFNKLAERYVPEVFSCALALVGNELLAERAVAAALERLAEELTQVYPDSIGKLLHALVYEAALGMSFSDLEADYGERSGYAECGSFDAGSCISR